MGVSLGSRGDSSKEEATLKHLAFCKNRRNGLNIAMKTWEEGSLPLLSVSLISLLTVYYCAQAQMCPVPQSHPQLPPSRHYDPREQKQPRRCPQASCAKCTTWLTPTPLFRLASCCQRMGHPCSSLSLTLHLCRPLVHVWTSFLQGLSLFCIVSFSLSITVLIPRCTHSLSGAPPATASWIFSLCWHWFPTSTVSWARSTTSSRELLLPRFPPTSSLAKPLHLCPSSLCLLRTEADATAHPLPRLSLS